MSTWIARARCSLATLLAWGLALLLSHAVAGSALAGTEADGPAVPEAWEDARIYQASRLIDRWSGEEHALLAEARALLDEGLRDDPQSAAGLVQYARLLLRTGVGPEHQPVEDTLGAAIELIDRALASDPSHSRAYVLRGHVLTRQSDHAGARASLQAAADLGSLDPWLGMNWADLWYADGDHLRAVEYWKHVAATDAGAGNVRVVAHENLIRHHRKSGSAEPLDASYRAIIDALPAAAWPRSTYANYLLCRDDDFEGALQHAQAALSIRDAVPSQLAASAALYRKWAAQVLDHNGRGAEQSWMAATGTVHADPVSVLGAVCTGDATLRPVLRALQVTGLGQPIPPMFAVMMAAENEQTGVMGLFAFEVKSVGRAGDDLFVGSEADYRDQRNLSLRIAPEAQRELHLLHRADPETMLMGKQVSVWGRVRRVRIDFTSDGLPTGKYYYQTQLAVRDAKQLQVRD